MTMPPLTAAQVSAPEIAERHRKVREKMEKAGLSAFVSFDPNNVYYLTNFANFVHERPFVLVLTMAETFLSCRCSKCRMCCVTRSGTSDC